jgi:hypothetical protein
MSTAAQEFESLLIAAMLDAATSGEITQLQTTITPPGKGARLVRIIVVPEEMSLVRPTGTGAFRSPV